VRRAVKTGAEPFDDLPRKDLQIGDLLEILRFQEIGDVSHSVGSFRGGITDREANQAALEQDEVSARKPRQDQLQMPFQLRGLACFPLEGRHSRSS
jgi:hypothetical protein